MNQCYLPICYFPTTTLLLEDSCGFINHFAAELSFSTPHFTIESPQDALKTLKFTTNTTLHRQNNEFANLPHANRIGNIHTEIYNPLRFSEIATVIVDYAMPGMNGLDFCQQLSALPVQRILLVDPKDEPIALEALDQGDIQRYFCKNDPDLPTHLLNGLRQAQFSYFKKISDHLAPQLTPLPDALHNRGFTQFFRDLCSQEKIIEYYLADQSGSYILLDAKGNLNTLYIRSREDLKQYHIIAQKNKVSTTILSQIKTGSRIPYVGLDALELEWRDWGTCTIEAKPLPYSKDYFYALNHDHRIFNIRKSKIVTFFEYLNNRAVSQSDIA